MNQSILTLAELAAKTEMHPDSVQEWVKLKLFSPSGFTDDHAPLFSEEALERAAHIRKLEGLGYGLEDIQRIIRKVGLPKERPGTRDRRDQKKYLTVGNLAEQSGVSPRTIKHWEDKGIIEPDRRSEGGFRLYSQVYVYLCKLIQDLQLFGYSLEEIKTVSGYFRDFLAMTKTLESFPAGETSARLDKMLVEIKPLFGKMVLFKEGIQRWEDLLKKKKKEILSLKDKNLKRSGSGARTHHA